MRWVLSDKEIRGLLRRELEGKAKDCKHGSYLRRHYFLSDSLQYWRRYIVCRITADIVDSVLMLYVLLVNLYLS